MTLSLTYFLFLFFTLCIKTTLTDFISLIHHRLILLSTMVMEMQPASYPASAREVVLIASCQSHAPWPDFVQRITSLRPNQTAGSQCWLQRNAFEAIDATDMRITALVSCRMEALDIGTARVDVDGLTAINAGPSDDLCLAEETED